MKSVCVFCGSRTGDDPVFERGAIELGRAIADKGLTLVYGGAKVGLMGVLANAALGAGGQVVGVIPKGLVSKEIAHDGLTEMFLTDTMNARKERMLTISDAFVALPGGFGTYDELFETITMTQIGFLEKPTGLFDIDGYFQPLIQLLDHTIARGFAATQHRDIVVVEKTAHALLDKLAAWTPVAEANPKWEPTA